jgi:hypothetical protein
MTTSETAWATLLLTLLRELLEAKRVFLWPDMPVWTTTAQVVESAKEGGWYGNS